MQGFGLNRKLRRQGGGRGTGSDHVHELMGSTEFYVYHSPTKPLKGYEAMKAYLQGEGCEAIYTTVAPVTLSGNYLILRITHRRGLEFAPEVVRRIHSWAHHQNLLHSFYKAFSLKGPP